MRRTSWVLAVVVGVAVVVGAVAADRVGPAAPPAADAPTVTSQTWYCPHGGGREWRGTLVLANPGTDTVPVRITSLGAKPGEAGEALELPPERTVLRPLVADSPDAATVVEAFDGEVGVGYLVRGGGSQTGLGAEPCVSTPATRWWTSSLSTEQGDHASLVVMNPFRAQAVFDIALFAADSPPVRNPAWTDLRLGPGRTATFDVSGELPGKEAVAAVVEGSAGRTVVGTLTTTDGGGIRAAVASPVLGTRWILPTAAGEGKAVLGVGVTDQDPVGFDVVLRSPESLRTVVFGGEQGAQSAGTVELTVEGPSAAELTTGEGPGVVAGLISLGEADDDAATGGTTATASRWIVTPTAAEEPWEPSIVLVNPGEEDAEVTLRTLPSADDIEPVEVTISVRAGRAITAPRAFAEADPRGAVLVSSSGPVVALGASTSSGIRGIAWYALALGVPLADAA